jgi:hypothetical protein
VRSGEPGEFLSLAARLAQTGSRSEASRCDRTHCAGVSQLWLATHDRRTPAVATVNHKSVYRPMREDNLLCLRLPKIVVTTDLDHGVPLYPNRTRTMVLTGLDQLCAADITYIRLLVEFIYLAVILDAFSQREIIWALERNLEDTLTLGALRMAHRAAAAGTRSGTSLRPRRAVRFAGLYKSAPGARHPDQHEPSRESLRHREVKIVPEDAEIGVKPRAIEFVAAKTLRMAMREANPNPARPKRR